MDKHLPVKVAILAEGLGTRIAEETKTKPKPLVEIGGCPIFWHSIGTPEQTALDVKRFASKINQKLIPLEAAPGASSGTGRMRCRLEIGFQVRRISYHFRDD